MIFIQSKNMDIRVSEYHLFEKHCYLIPSIIVKDLDF
jgi:hypothetical protein